MSRSQTPGKFRSSFRLYFFTSLSVIACALALANVASAATPSAEDQYVEQAPRGGGDADNSENVETNVGTVDANNDGVVTEAEVKAAAKKNKAKKKKATGDEDSEEGASGGTGAVSGATPTPPAAESVATAAKFGPVSQTTALIGGAVLLLIGIGAVAFGGSSGEGAFGLGGGGSSSGPPPPSGR